MVDGGAVLVGEEPAAGGAVERVRTVGGGVPLGAVVGERIAVAGGDAVEAVVGVVGGVGAIGDIGETASSVEGVVLDLDGSLR
jgi:hypothetical protein